MKYLKKYFIWMILILPIFCGKTDHKISEIHQVFAEFQKALADENIDNIKLRLTMEKADEIPDENAGNFIKMIKEMRPKNIKILKTTVKERPLI